MVLEIHQERVQTEWIDYNGHMNVAYYVLVFDHATDALMDYLGLDENYRSCTQCSIYVLESHINYLRELVVDAPVSISTQLLGFDRKRLHIFHRMYHQRERFLAATTELMIMHIDMRQAKAAEFPLSISTKIENLWENHNKLDVPEQVGRVIGLPVKRPT